MALMKNEWHWRMLLSLFLAYMGYYFCRTNLAVAAPLLQAEGIDKDTIGKIASVGIMCYVLGKVASIFIGDFLKGKMLLVGAMLGAVACTLLFSMGAGLMWFFVFWGANRFVQSFGWGGLLKISANWFSFRIYGSVMALLSLSFLLGDTLAKLLFGELIKQGFTWRELFWVGASVSTFLAVLSIFTLKNKPPDNAPDVNPDNVFLEKGKDEKPENIKSLLLPYLKNIPFWCLMLTCFGMTAIRETLNFWLPTFLHEAGNLTKAQAASFSAWYPFFGMISTVLCGFASDKLLNGRRGIVVAVACVGVMGLFLFKQIGFSYPFIFMASMGVLLLGPYSFLAGAMALDKGGRRGTAAAAGMIDAFGYVGGAYVTYLAGAMAKENGWNAVFTVLAAAAAFTATTAFLYFWLAERKRKPLNQ